MILAEKVQAESGIELAHAGASTLGMALALRLREGLGWSNPDRLRVADILARLDTGPDSLGGAVLQATALGGAKEGDTVASGKLGVLFRDSNHRTVRQTALVNMGGIADLRTLLAETRVSLEIDVPDEATALLQSDLLAAIRNVLLRHPEDVAAALDIYRQALTRWRTDSPLGKQLVSDVLLGLVDLRLPESRKLLESLTRSEDRYVSAVARKALRKLGPD